MDVLRSAHFDDIYFSPDDGLAETRYVFLDGNDLPANWQNKKDFTIFETGFGTGLNFLATWDLFEKTRSENQVLHYISVERYPLAVDQIRGALSHWQRELGDKLEGLLEQYPLRIQGFHRISLAPHVQLTLLFDDVKTALEEVVIPRGVNAWFLDGFAPAKNPDMWSDYLFSSMKRLSAPEATVATFTAAGAVRRGLAENGFEVWKDKGFGRKRDMVKARFGAEGAVSEAVSVKRVAIIGGGLAGTAAAHVLKSRGVEAVLFEASDHLASGASGNERGLYNPRLYAQRMPDSLFYRSAYAQAHAAFRALPDDIGWQSCGALHFITGEDKRKRFGSMIDEGEWHEDHAVLLTAAEASKIAGVSIAYDALFLPDSGFVSPAVLCQAYAAGSEVRLSARIEEIKPRDMGWGIGDECFDEVIIAAGLQSQSFDGLSWLPLHAVRGQLSYMNMSNMSEALKACLCYGGYIAPAVNGQHACGATFQKWDDDPACRKEDDQENLVRLQEAVPQVFDDLSVSAARAGFRTATQDHIPLIGRAPSYDQDKGAGRLPYISVGHGSHGIVSSLMAAHIIADNMLASPSCVQKTVADAVDPARFIRRWKKKKQSV